MGIQTKLLESKEQTALKDFNDLVSQAIGDIEPSLFAALKAITDLLLEEKLPAACGLSRKIDLIISRHRVQIQSLINLRIKPIFNENHQFSFTSKEIEAKVNSIYQWFDEINSHLNEFRIAINQKDRKNVQDKYGILQDKILYNNSSNDLAESLRYLLMDYLLYLQSRPKDELSQIFDRLNFHIVVKKSSEALFKDGHYSQAILDSSKALINYVRDKSELDTRNDRKMMFDAFMPQKENDTIIKPRLCLNKLYSDSDWDEQEGFAFIFNGLVAGVRNPKAHDNVIQKDPYKTLEYLALISLLAKRTDEAMLNP